MNEKSKKSLIDILSENDYLAFEESAKSKLIEKIAWNHYLEIEKDIKKRLDINKTEKSKQP